MSPDDPRHGTRPGYYAHRKDGEGACAACKRAAATAEARRQLNLSRDMPGRVSALGTSRRLQGLAFLGYNWVLLGSHIGSSEGLIRRWAERDTPGSYVFADTARRVAEVCERLSMTLPPETTPGERNAASRSRNRAKHNGWVPLLAWTNIDDPDETPTGVAHRPVSNRPAAELVAEWDHLRGCGVSEHHAAQQLGVSIAAVEKARERMGRAA